MPGLMIDSELCQFRFRSTLPTATRQFVANPF
jgi:hypothetical protein